MPHYKCVPCRARLYVPRSPDELDGDLCPDCGCLLEPVSDLSELVGFRSIEPIDGDADGAKSAPHQRVADRIDEFARRRAAILSRDAMIAACRADDGGDLRADAVALPLPETYL